MRNVSKKIVSCFLSFAVAGGIFACAPIVGNAANTAFGDVNSDGRVDSADALAVLNHCVDRKLLGPSALIAADVNADKKVNSADALDILKYSVGLIERFKADETAEPNESEIVEMINAAVKKVEEEQPSYLHKEKVSSTAESVKVSGPSSLLISKEKLKQLEDQTKADKSYNKTYNKIVRQKSEDSADRMITPLSDDISLYKSVSYSKAENDLCVLTVCFKDETDSGRNSPIVSTFSLPSYGELKKELEESESIEGAKSKVDSLALSYKDCVLRCEVDTKTGEFKSIEWNVNIVSESEVTTVGLTVSLKSVGSSSASYTDFGY